jgi:hypothetical protein
VKLVFVPGQAVAATGCVVIPVNGFTVITAEPWVKPVVRWHPKLPITATMVYVVVAEGETATVNGTPLCTPDCVYCVAPMLYTIVKGATPLVAVKVRVPCPPGQMVLPLRLPCGSGLTVTVAAFE